MTLSDYRQSPSWKGAVDLGPQLVSLAEELPAAEELGLSWQLRQLMVEVPACIAADLLDGSATRRPAVFRLLAVLELIDRVYPALDTAATRQQAEDLAQHLLEEDFGKAPTPKDQAPAEAAPMPAQAPAPVSEPAKVPVLSDHDAPAPAPVVETTRVSVQAVAAEETQQSDVHPDSVE